MFHTEYPDHHNDSHPGFHLGDVAKMTVENTTGNAKLYISTSNLVPVHSRNGEESHAPREFYYY